MNIAGQQSWQKLLDAGLVEGQMPAARPLESPWYVRLMLGAAGWLAALFLLGFVAAAMAWITKSEPASMVTGVLMMALAWLGFKKLSKNEFAAQFAMAVSFAGQAMFIFGVFGWLGAEKDSTASWTAVALLQAALALIMPNAIHRLWSAFAMAICFYMALYSVHVSLFSTAITLAAASWLWLNEFTWPQRGPTFRPIAYGLLVALIVMDVVTGAFRPLSGMNMELAEQGPLPPWLGEILVGAVLLWVVWTLLKRQNLAIPGQIANAAMVASLALVLVSFKAPGISVGVCILILGFAHGNRILTGLGCAALLLYISTYYYSLDVTLLVKSQALALTGAVVLTLRWVLLRWLSSNPVPDHE